MAVKIALAAGLACLIVAVGVTLLGAPIGVVRSNRTPGNEAALWETRLPTTLCQAHESLPAGTSAIRLWLAAAAGPRISVAVMSDGSVLTSGSRPSIWVGGSVTVPVRPVRRAASNVSVCMSFPLRDEAIIAQGSQTGVRAATREGGEPLVGRVGIEYLRPTRRSWASRALGIARRMGLGRAAPGTWIALAPLALLAAIVLLSSRLVLRELS